MGASQDSARRWLASLLASPGRVGRVAGLAAILVGLGWAPQALAERPPQTFDIGLAPTLLVGVSDVCQRDFDQTSCTFMSLFAGADLTAHFWPLDFIGIGPRLALARDLDAVERVSDAGPSFDPQDQYMFRATAEVRIDPPVLPDGLWLGAELGVALLHEQDRDRIENRLVEVTATQTAPLFGLAVGWDIWLGESLTLTPELRGQLIFFGDPPELRDAVDAHDYGTSSWVELALRLACIP